MKPAIRVENLGKRYQVNHTSPRGQYRTLRETLTNAAMSPLRRFKNGGTNGSTEDFWALKDVSFEVQPGEVVGIIGRNGAGKSTLLKVLSRITEPSHGNVAIRGRIGSLLEVGTGFHPELTGRENVFLNGSILGMSRREIQQQFDPIVDFAGVEQFLDTPVKRYSSGMYVRLAFAVAAHLNPEILVIDEVLAVGDSEFQKRCLQKMHDVSRSGRTVLFVSHNMATVESLCQRCLLLNGGHVAFSGDTNDALSKYHRMSELSQDSVTSLIAHPGRAADCKRLMESAELRTHDHKPTTAFSTGDTLRLAVTFSGAEPDSHIVLGVVFKTQLGAAVFGINNRVVPGFTFTSATGAGRIECTIDDLPLMPGLYSADLYLGDAHNDVDAVFQAVTFEVLTTDIFNSGKLPPRHAGPICWPARYNFHAAMAAEV